MGLTTWHLDFELVSFYGNGQYFLGHSKVTLTPLSSSSHLDTFTEFSLLFWITYTMKTMAASDFTLHFPQQFVDCFAHGQCCIDEGLKTASP